MENSAEQKTNAGQGLGIAGLVLGIISFPLAFIPCVNLFAAIFAIVGIILSAIGLSQASKRNGAKGLNLAGLILSILAFLIIIAWGVFFANAAKEGGKFWHKFGKEIQQEVQKEMEQAGSEIGTDLEEQLEALEGDSTQVMEELSPEQFDTLLKDYENLIKEYIALSEKVKKNDLSSLPKFTQIAAKAASVGARLMAAAPNMTQAQSEKFDEIQKKYEAALEQAGQ